MDRKAEGGERLWVQVEPAGLGRTYRLWRDTYAPPALLCGKVGSQLQREKQWLPRHLDSRPLPGVNCGASLPLGKRMLLVSASLIFTKLTFFTRRTFLAELVLC